MARTLVCFAEGRDGSWEAICVDFDLAVQGGSLPEVFSRLNQAIIDYIRYVETLPAEERSAFYRRRTPFIVRMRYLLRSLFGGLMLRRSGSGAGRAEFTIPCPA